VTLHSKCTGALTFENLLLQHFRAPNLRPGTTLVRPAQHTPALPPRVLMPDQRVAPSACLQKKPVTLSKETYAYRPAGTKQFV
jgi:hypothetical protein